MQPQGTGYYMNSRPLIIVNTVLNMVALTICHISRWGLMITHVQEVPSAAYSETDLMSGPEQTTLSLRLGSLVFSLAKCFDGKTH